MKVLLVSTFAVFSVVAAIASDTVQVSQDDGETGKMVADIVSSRHIAHPEINDDISARLLSRYVDLWDPQKLYFFQSDIDEFNASRNVLDDEIRSGDVGFASSVFNRYLLRMTERIAMVGKVIDTEHDFTVDEEMVTEADDLAWAQSETELAERWRKRIKFDLLMQKLDDKDISEARTKIHKRYNNNLNLMKQTEPHEVLELYLSAMTHCLDPHSTYMSPQTLEEFQMTMRLQLSGIGARLRFEDGNTVVDEVLKGGPAFEDGTLVKGDKIVGVDADGPGGSIEMVDVVDMKLSKVVEKIRGQKETKVTLDLQHEGGGRQELILTRGEVKLTEQEVKGEIIEAGTWIDGQQAKIGVLNIPSFYRDFQGANRGGQFKSTSRDVRKWLAMFRDQGVQSLIVDLRWNGGGSLTEAIEVSGLFIPRGPVVQVRAPQDDVTVYPDEDPEMVWKRPMIVVCNRLSASASEIFAGAMKDYRRAIIVGDKTTHGKGTVQNVLDVTPRLRLFGRNRGAVKLTISKFYRVNGDSTQNKGVTSDVVLPSIWDERDVGEDSLDNALAFDRIQRAKYLPFTNFRTDEETQILAQRSAARVGSDSEFQKLKNNIARYVERKNRKTISLNESVLRKEEEELERERKEEEEAAKMASGNSDSESIFENNFYNKELLNIMLDYTELMTKRLTANR